MGRLNFLYRMDLPHRALSVYIYLSDRANKNGECWPAIPTIANELKLSQSTVRRALRDGFSRKGRGAPGRAEMPAPSACGYPR